MSHTVYTRTEITCDALPDGPQGPPCMKPFRWHGAVSKTNAASLLKSKGWHTSQRGNRHICPDCWTKGQR